MTQGTDHERNDKIEATVMMAALASLGLLVAMAVSTSVTAVTGPNLQAVATPNSPDTTREAAGIDSNGLQRLGGELR